jgi:sigma-E factor negative regulatory protein RseC
MADNIGMVLRTEPGGWAFVSTDRKVACGGCGSHPSACAGCLTGAQRMESRVANPISARAGDVVKVHLASENIFTGAVILYLVPILALLIGAFTGARVAHFFGLQAVSGGLLGTLIGLIAGFGAVIAVDRSAVMHRRMTPTITAIVAGEHPALKPEHASCCG